MDDTRKSIGVYIPCEKCSKSLTNGLTKSEEEDLTNSVIEVLEKYPISYAEAHRVLDCVNNKLYAMADNLKL